MGNRISIAQEEKDEAEFQHLVNEVARTRGQYPGVNDLESGYRPNRFDNGRIVEDSNTRFYAPYDRSNPYLPFGADTLPRPGYLQHPPPLPAMAAPAAYIPPIAPTTIPVIPYHQQAPTPSTPDKRDSLSTISERTSQSSRHIESHQALIHPPAETPSSPLVPPSSSASLVSSYGKLESPGQDVATLPDREQSPCSIYIGPPRSRSSTLRHCDTPAGAQQPPETVKVGSRRSSLSDRASEHGLSTTRSSMRSVFPTAPAPVLSEVIPVVDRTRRSRSRSWSRSRSHSRGRSLSPIVVRASTPATTPPVVVLPRARCRSHSRSYSSHTSRSRSWCSHSPTCRRSSPTLQPRVPAMVQMPGQTIVPNPIRISPPRSPRIIVRTERPRSPDSPRIIIRTESRRSCSRSRSPGHHHPTVDRLSRSPSRRKHNSWSPIRHSPSPCRRHRISKSPPRIHRTSRSPIRRDYSWSPTRILPSGRAPPGAGSASAISRSRSHSPRGREATFQSGVIPHGYPSAPLIIQPPMPLPTDYDSTPIVIQPPATLSTEPVGIDRLYHAVESFQRATQELLDFQREQQEHHRQYEDRLLAALRWRDTGAPYSRPHTPSIAAHNRTEERFTEKKEIHLRDGFDVRAYPNIPFAAGLAIGIQNIPSWQPVWQVFPLKAFRGSDYTFLKIQPQWDDADLLRELSKTYDRLRTWRKWFSLRNVSGITMVLADHSFVYPQRVGPARVSPAKNMRLRYLLQHPHTMRRRYEFMQVMTSRTDLGIEFVERFELKRIAFAVFLPVVLATLFGVLWAVLTGDVSSAFTVSGYMTSAYSVCLVLVGVINLVEY